jgi:hypothetical protein
MRDLQEIRAIGVIRGFVEDRSKTEVTFNTSEDIAL